MTDFLLGALTALVVTHFAHVIWRRYTVVERPERIMQQAFDMDERRHRDRNGPPR